MEHVNKQSEQGEEENSSDEALDKPGGETAASGELQDHQGCHEGDRKQHNDTINAPC